MSIRKFYPRFSSCLSHSFLFFFLLLNQWSTQAIGEPFYSEYGGPCDCFQCIVIFSSTKGKRINVAIFECLIRICHSVAVDVDRYELFSRSHRWHYEWAHLHTLECAQSWPICLMHIYKFSDDLLFSGVQMRIWPDSIWFFLLSFFYNSAFDGVQWKKNSIYWKTRTKKWEKKGSRREVSTHSLQPTWWWRGAKVTQPQALRSVHLVKYSTDNISFSGLVFSTA